MNPDTRSEIVRAVVEFVGLKDYRIKYATIMVPDCRFTVGTDLINIDNSTLDLQLGEAVTIEIRRSL